MNENSIDFLVWEVFKRIFCTLLSNFLDLIVIIDEKNRAFIDSIQQGIKNQKNKLKNNLFAGSKVLISSGDNTIRTTLVHKLTRCCRARGDCSVNFLFKFKNF